MKRRQRKELLAGIAATFALLVGLLGYVGSLGIPPSEATRLRNAFLLEAATAVDIDWKPDAVPASFKAEQLAPSERFRNIVDDLHIERLPSDWHKALALAGQLTANARDSGPIQSDLATTYRKIVEDGRGYCADFTKAYLALAHAAGLFAREWAFSLDGFGGSGHAFIEVYDRQRGRWIWLDVYNNVHAIDAVSGEPLSAGELRAFALGERGNVTFRPNGPGRLGYKHNDKLIDYYRRGATEWYLWAGNNVFSYDSHPLVRAGFWLGAPVEQLLAVLAGVHPQIKALLSEQNAQQYQRMVELRSILSYLMFVALLLGLLLVLQLWMLWARWRSERQDTIRSRGASDDAVPT